MEARDEPTHLMTDDLRLPILDLFGLHKRLVGVSVLGRVGTAEKRALGDLLVQSVRGLVGGLATLARNRFQSAAEGAAAADGLVSPTPV